MNYLICSTFENNIGNNGILTVTHFPLTFNGTTKFIGNKGSDALQVCSKLVQALGYHFIHLLSSRSCVSL